MAADAVQADGGVDQSFLSLLTELGASPRAEPRDAWATPMADPAGPWLRMIPAGAVSPEQGWKLHVSASEATAKAVLGRAVPVLLAHGANFKVASSPRALHSLNTGEAGMSQIGKFITVYPGDDAQAVRLASALHEATQGLAGPPIPSDRPLAPGSLVHYRYGGFGGRYMQTPLGEIVPALLAVDGTLVPDRRLASYQCPHGIEDPFLAAGVATPTPAPTRLIAERYLTVATLHRSPRGTVHLALDLDHGRRCVLKRAYPAAALGQNGQDARARLRHEAGVLGCLPVGIGPAVYDLLEDGEDLLLAMEDVEGITLEAYLSGQLMQGILPSGEDIVRLGRQLTAALGAVHAAGFVYRDLKSPNVIVLGDGNLRLIDFELAYRVTAEEQPHGLGTRGYMSPRQAEGLSPAVTDDVYALGALLFLLATGADPSLAPRPDRLLDRPLSLLNPAAPAALEPLIARCLAHDPSDRYQSMSALNAVLGEIGLVAPTASTFGEGAREDVRRRAGEMAGRLGDTLCAMSVPAPEGTGRTWHGSHQLGSGVRSRDINTGAAGSLLALAEIAGARGEARHRGMVAEAARWLRVAPHLGEQPLPGLYVGEAGVGAALLRAGQVLGDPELIAAAEARGRWIAGLPYGAPFASPDLFNGAAGRLRFHLLLWDETAGDEHLAAARSAGEAVLDAAEWIGDEGDACRWSFPDGYEGLSGHAYLGYAHGAAGIADALLDLYEATREERFRAAAVGAARWLLGLARPALVDGTGLDWPGVENGPAGRLWCHGASGIAILFVHLARLDALPGAWEVARRAARTAGMGARATSPVQCHGLAGQIETLLDVAAAGDPRSGEDAAQLAVLLAAFAVERDGLLVFSSESPTIFTPDYMVGYAGVAACLLRLSDPGRPRQLSRAGFRYRPA